MEDEARKRYATVSDQAENALGVTPDMVDLLKAVTLFFREVTVHSTPGEVSSGRPIRPSWFPDGSRRYQSGPVRCVATSLVATSAASLPHAVRMKLTTCPISRSSSVCEKGGIPYGRAFAAVPGGYPP